MKKTYWLILLLPAVLIALAAMKRAGNCRAAGERGPSAGAGVTGGAGDLAANGFAVVELFTSEGCSSCPAADAVVARAARDYKENVYVLGFHVDYWDRLGWQDIYSSAAYTQRQQEYASLFRLNSIYTPEVVVNGKKEFVGSDENKLRTTIGEELKSGSGSTVEILSAVAAGNKLSVSCSVKSAGKAYLKIALVQLQAVSQVKRGENEGKKLEHSNVVRDFKSLSPDEKGVGRAELKIPEGLTAKDCKVIVFLQEKSNGHILAAAEIKRIN